jgi:chromosomal replication initiation ATPase DnaA
MTRETVRPSIRRIAEDEAAEAGITLDAIRGESRHRPIASARQRAMRRAFWAGFSSAAIGRFFGRDHTTVLYAAGTLTGKQPRHLGLEAMR